MGERKVLNKYYPPDFDPSIIPKGKRKATTQVKVRMMLPMSLKCNNCGEYMARGTKFNSRKETVENEDYLGIPIYRFYFKCRLCSCEITFKTDPKRSDYQTEHGASRSYEPFEEVESDDENEKEEEDTANPMKTLEEMTMTSKREMDLMDALDEMKSQNARRAMMSPDDVLRLRKSAETSEGCLRQPREAGVPTIEVNEEYRPEIDLDKDEVAEIINFREEQVLRYVDTTVSTEKQKVENTQQQSSVPSYGRNQRSLLSKIQVMESTKRRKQEPNGLSALADYDSSDSD